MNPKLPGYSELLFNVELVDFSYKEKRKDEMTNAERINLSMTMKNNGNDYFKKQDYDTAYREYSKGSDLLTDMFNLTDDEELKQKALITQVNSNLANACLKIKKYTEAIKACDRALKIDVSAKI
mmetsp:Transcript_30221/g.66035  ORF Transcript_30221/g.66035 Transcript_30221/m.66035 type:complete len:124 (+) Transcript_30221:362-733(+)